MWIKDILGQSIAVNNLNFFRKFDDSYYENFGNSLRITKAVLGISFVKICKQNNKELSKLYFVFENKLWHVKSVPSYCFCHLLSIFFFNKMHINLSKKTTIKINVKKNFEDIFMEVISFLLGNFHRNKNRFLMEICNLKMWYLFPIHKCLRILKHDFLISNDIIWVSGFKIHCKLLTKCKLEYPNCK